MLQILRGLVDAYCDGHRLRRIGTFRCVRRGPELVLSRGGVSVVGRLSAPVTLVGSFVARCNRLEVDGRPLLLSDGFHFAVAARKLLAQAAVVFFDNGEREEADLLLYLAVGEGLLHEDEDVELRSSLLARARRKPALTDSLKGTHVAAVKKAMPWVNKSNALDRIRGLYAVTSVLEEASYANELKLEALIGAAVIRSARSPSAAEREAALGAAKALVSILLLGCAYREIVPYATAVIEAGVDTATALASRFVGLAANLDASAEKDAVALMKCGRHPSRAAGWFKQPLATENYLLHMRVRAARALMLNARGRDPCVRRLKASVVKPSRERRAMLLAAAQEQLREAERLLTLGAAVTDEVRALKTELAKLS